MALSALYAVRGFLAFVAFIELVNAIRSLSSSLFVDPEDLLKGSFVQEKIFTEAKLSRSADLIISQLFCIYSLLTSSLLVVCAVCIHVKPILCLTFLALSFKTLFYLVQGLVFHTINISAGLQVPLLISLLALLGLLSVPWMQEGERRFTGSENDDLVRQMKFGRARKLKNL